MREEIKNLVENAAVRLAEAAVERENGNSFGASVVEQETEREFEENLEYLDPSADFASLWGEVQGRSNALFWELI